MTVVELPADPFLRVLAAGDDVYVFTDGDCVIDLQETVCIAANLDTQRYKIKTSSWADVRARLNGVKVIDCRRT